MTPPSRYRWLIVGMLQLILALWLWQLALPQVSGSLRTHLVLAGIASAALGAYCAEHGLKDRQRQ